jgi:hypothetical protein
VHFGGHFFGPNKTRENVMTAGLSPPVFKNPVVISYIIDCIRATPADGANFIPYTKLLEVE